MEFGYIISGFGVGMLVGITGVGGGSLMTPLLVFLFGFKPIQHCLYRISMQQK